MATQAYYQWDASGRRFVLANPIKELQAWAESDGFTVLGTIGDEAHLQASIPQDHTPFSFTAHPVPLPGYVVCAIDIAEQRGLGAALLAGARTGLYPWLKYMNVGGRHYDYRDGFQSSTPNSDRHNHLSILTTWIDRSIGAFDPFGGGTGDNVYCNYGDTNRNVEGLQAALRNLGFDIAVDGNYGDQTAGAVLAAFETGDGREFGPWQWGALVGKLNASGGGGTPGPQGPAGPPGPKGVPGVPGPVPTAVTLELTGIVKPA